MYELKHLEKNWTDMSTEYLKEYLASDETLMLNSITICQILDVLEERGELLEVSECKVEESLKAFKDYLKGRLIHIP